MTPNPAIVAVADAYEGFMSRYTPFAWGGQPCGCPMDSDLQAGLPESQILDGRVSVLLHAW